MTRAEKAAEKVRKAKAKEQALAQKLKEARAKQQEETRKAETALQSVMRQEDNKKRYHWGAIAHEAGLFGWGTSDWIAVCAALAKLVDTPDPGAVLEGLLVENGVVLLGTSDDLE